MKKILRLCVAIILCAVGLAVSVGAADVLYSGTCGAEGDGSNLTWSLDSEGVLRIEGKGMMKDYDSLLIYSRAPWYEYRHSIGIVSIGKGVSSIGNSAFYDCDVLRSVSIPEGVTSIGNSTFSGCNSLSSVTIPETVTSIGYMAFYRCDSLTSVTIPEGVTSIGDYTFYSCESLTTVTIPSSVTSIGEYAFEHCSSLTSVKFPEYVTSIGDFAFFGCKNLSSVLISENLLSIGKFAFYGCSSITAVRIPESVLDIGYYAFCNCKNLKVISVDKNNQSYSNDEFGVLYNKDKTELIQYPAGNDAITYYISKGVTLINFDAFYLCNNLQAIFVNENNRYYSSDGHGVLFNKNKTQLIQYPAGNNAPNYETPSSVKSIESYAFYGCEGLKSVNISYGVTSIGNKAFYDCIRLTSVTIPSSVTTIGLDAFYNCNKLTSITVDKNNQKYSSDERGVLFDKNKTELIKYPAGNTASSYVVPDGVKEFENFAFFGCKNLTSVTIPSSMTIIAPSAFKDCINLTSVTIPKSVNKIWYAAFSGCDNLQTVYYNGTRAQFDKIDIDDKNEPLLNAKFVNSHPVLSTDIRSYIYGSEIESYNVNGSTCVVAEDLMNYGFTVLWDGNARTLSVTHPSEDFTQEIKRDFGAKTGSIGEKIAETVPTNIVTYVNGKVVPSFNIGGRTVIYIDSLAVFGSVVWDGGARTISLG